VKVNLLFVAGIVAIITANHDRLRDEWRHLVRSQQRWWFSQEPSPAAGARTESSEERRRP
ncbi:MAG: hypothetical protein M3Q59_06655, partial [Actinomycetota bacterium]|nr:hypothetical protein [Actinomycetota bacterium]